MLYLILCIAHTDRLSYHDSIVVPVLVLAKLGTVAEATDTEVKVATHGASYPNCIRDVLTAWVAMVFHSGLGYFHFQGHTCISFPYSYRATYRHKNLPPKKVCGNGGII
jgi:hypothetical protein